MISARSPQPPVRDLARSRQWYVDNLGLRVELEVPEQRTVALEDDGGLTLFLFDGTDTAAGCTLTFQVDDVEAKHRELAGRGVVFDKSPQKLLWGYGAELRDPDGTRICLWDERTMREKGGR